MKSALTVLLAALLLTGTGTAYAKPKASFSCKLTDLQQWGSPDYDDVDIVIVVRLSCRGTAPGARIKASDVTLLNTDGQKYGPDDDREAFDTIYEDEDPGPTFVDRYIDLPQGKTRDIGFTFSGGNGLTDPHLTLDISGTKFHHSRKRVEEYNAE
jgi:hypothetical protein